MTKKRLFLLVLPLIAVVAALIGWRLLIDKNNNQAPRTSVVERRTIVQDVAFTGRLYSVRTADLGFESTGVVRRLSVDVGDRVVAGQPLASLDTRLASLDVAKARADRVSAAQDALLSWQAAQSDQSSTKAANARTVEKSRQAVRDAKAELDHRREVWEQVVREIGDESSVARTSYSLVLTATTAYHSSVQALAAAEKTAAKDNQAAADSTRITQSQYLATQQAASGVAGLSSLAATEAMAGVRLVKNTLTAPFDGVITQKTVDIDEVATGGTPVLSIESVDELEVTADVPETDAAKFKIGDEASLSFDAFPNTEPVSAIVARLAPAAVVIEGVPTYQVKMRLLSVPPITLKPGQTTNITVHAAKRDNALSVPRRSVFQRGSEARVRVLSSGNEVMEKTITVGLVGSDGSIEVISGLNEGERVVLEQAPAE